MNLELGYPVHLKTEERHRPLKTPANKSLFKKTIKANKGEYQVNRSNLDLERTICYQLNLTGTKESLLCENLFYRAFLVTWPATMHIYWNLGSCIHKKRVQLPMDWFGTTAWPPFCCLETSKIAAVTSYESSLPSLLNNAYLQGKW